MITWTVEMVECSDRINDAIDNNGGVYMVWMTEKENVLGFCNGDAVVNMTTTPVLGVVLASNDADAHEQFRAPVFATQEGAERFISELQKTGAPIDATIHWIPAILN